MTLTSKGYCPAEIIEKNFQKFREKERIVSDGIYFDAEGTSFSCFVFNNFIIVHNNNNDKKTRTFYEYLVNIELMVIIKIIIMIIKQELFMNIKLII